MQAAAALNSSSDNNSNSSSSTQRRLSNVTVIDDRITRANTSLSFYNMPPEYVPLLQHKQTVGGHCRKVVCHLGTRQICCTPGSCLCILQFKLLMLLYLLLSIRF
jgi:hypothetical protein